MYKKKKDNSRGNLEKEIGICSIQIKLIKCINFILYPR